MNSIVNIKSRQPYDVYCGHANSSYGLAQSKWANPFVIGKHGDRAQVILKYRLWLNSQPDLLAALPELKGKTLACWCNVPQEDCHCQVLAELCEAKWIKNWFSNMLPFDEPMTNNGITYATPENFYQALKVNPAFDELRREIAAMQPGRAKSAGRRLSAGQLREDWSDEYRLVVMEHVLEYKFRPWTSWAQKLDMTENWPIVEWNNWGDTFFGKDLKTRVGENHLGEILMQIREENRWVKKYNL